MVALTFCQRATPEDCERPRPESERCRITRGEKKPTQKEAAEKTAPSRDIPNLNLGELSPAQRELFFSVVEDQFDPCGKPRSFGETLRGHQDACPLALPLARFVIERVLAGEPRTTIVHELVARLQLEHNRLKLDLEGAPRLGPADAAVTIVEFSDFTCPYCRAVQAELQKLLKAHPDVALVFKLCPVEHHARALPAAEAAAAAALQGKFWEMHDSLFKRGAMLDEDAILAAAKEAGLDLARFAKDRGSAAVREHVERDIRDADRAAVEGTPSFWVEGVEVPFEALETLLDKRRESPKTGEP